MLSWMQVVLVAPLSTAEVHVLPYSCLQTMMRLAKRCLQVEQASEMCTYLTLLPQNRCFCVALAPAYKCT